MNAAAVSIVTTALSVNVGVASAPMVATPLSAVADATKSVLPVQRALNVQPPFAIVASASSHAVLLPSKSVTVRPERRSARPALKAASALRTSAGEENVQMAALIHFVAVAFAMSVRTVPITRSVPLLIVTQ